jgi:acyl-CoA thioester hydrolase
VTTTLDVRFYELDPYGHVNHGVYLNYFEVARVELLEALGYGLPRLRELGFHIVVVEVTVRFHAPARAGDRLEVHSRIAQLRRASSTWDQRILRGDELIATNVVRAAITDATGRPAPPPPGLGEALRRLRDDTARSWPDGPTHVAAGGTT